MLHKLIYKRRSDGGIQQWQMESSGNTYRTISGIKDGTLVYSAWTTAFPKNLGKSNETSAEEQATLEVEAEYTKKLAQGGYHEHLSDIDSPKFFKPMLAKTYREDYTPTLSDYKNNLVCSQPKLDGGRCIATIDGLWTRQGKPILSVPHIVQSLAPLFDKDPNLILDGELYCDKLSNDFDKIMSLVRKSKPSSNDIKESAQYIQYWVYDMPSLAEPFYFRINLLRMLLSEIKSPNIIIVPTATSVPDIQQLDALYGGYIHDGYEGQMIRISKNVYENKRTKQLLKRKEFKDEEFTVVDIVEGIGNRSGMAGMVLYDLGDGRTFGSGIRGNFDYYTKILAEKDKYIGGEGTVRYQNKTPDGIPRFPVTITLYGGKRDI